jgi:CubicO group peptidase (beta-lactamase class C family)
MRSLSTLLAGLGLLLAATTASAQTTPATAPAAVPSPAPLVTSRYPATALGLAIGWGAPYGWGLELSHMVTPKLDVNAGVGITITGGKVGVGTRYYFNPERKVSAFVGGNLVRSTGWNNIHVTTNSTSTNGGQTYYASGDDAVVNFLPATLLHLRGGVRWQPIRRFAMLGALGYGIVLGGETVEYVSGNYSQNARNGARLLAPGGVEISYGIAFGLD